MNKYEKQCGCMGKCTLLVIFIIFWTNNDIMIKCRCSYIFSYTYIYYKYYFFLFIALCGLFIAYKVCLEVVERWIKNIAILMIAEISSLCSAQCTAHIYYLWWMMMKISFEWERWRRAVLCSWIHAYMIDDVILSFSERFFLLHRHFSVCFIQNSCLYCHRRYR